MRLVKLHIDNFGTLSNFDFDFKKDLNCILQENGWGKSTLTVFIKAMLYGLDVSKVRDLDKNERNKYIPWNGQTYGGTLVFEVNNKEYRIERTFANKEADDIYKVYDLQTNRETKMFKDSVGLTLFEIDSDAFEKSMYIPQKDFDFEFGDNLKSRLANIFGKLDDSQDVSVAEDEIDKKEKEISKKAGGKLSILKAKSSELEDIIKSKSNDINQIPGIQKNIDDLKNKKKALIERKEDIAKKFKDIENVATKNANIKLAKEKEEAIKNKESNLKELDIVFDDQDVSKINLKDLDSDYTKLIKLEAEGQAIAKSLDNYDEYLSLEKDFEGKKLSDDVINSIDNDIKEYSSYSNVQASVSQTKKKLSKPAIGLIISAGVAIIASLVCIAFNMIAFGVCLAIGLALLIAALFMIVLKPSSGSISYNQVDNKDKDELEAKLVGFFAKYGFYGKGFINFQIELKNKLFKYNHLKQANAEIINNTSINQKALEEVKDKLNKSLSIYKLKAESIKERIDELKAAITNHNSLTQEINNLKEEHLKFVQDNNLNVETTIVEADVGELQGELKKLDIEIEQINSKIKEQENVLDNLYESEQTIKDDETEFNEIKDNMKALAHKSKMLKTTLKLIKEADELVKAKYVKPMSDKVRKYIDDLLGKDNLDFNLDTDFNFNGLENSKQKDIKYYSKGYRESVSICLRLALIDCLFTKEKPFLLLDDPFVDLDNKKLKQAIGMLQNIAKDKQVVYLTCHDSRKI